MGTPPLAVRFTVGESDEGRSIERLLLSRIEQLRYGAVRAWLRKGRVRVGGAAVRPGRRVHAGEEVEVRLPEGGGSALAANPRIAWAPLAETPLWVAVDKPAGVVVLPAPGHPRDALANGLVTRYPELRRLGERRSWGLVHRLDRETSGVILVARRSAAQDALEGQFRRREVEKRYLALVHGRPPASFEADEPIAERRKGGRTLAVVAPPGRGREAHTGFRRVGTRGGVSLVEARPQTGRFHQVRVHLARRGFPVVGDDEHGDGARDARLCAASRAGRLFLHAAELAFRDPADGQARRVVSPLPAELRSALDELGLVAEPSGES